MPQEPIQYQQSSKRQDFSYTFTNPACVTSWRQVAIQVWGRPSTPSPAHPHVWLLWKLRVDEKGSFNSCDLKTTEHGVDPETRPCCCSTYWKTKNSQIVAIKCWGYKPRLGSLLKLVVVLRGLWDKTALGEGPEEGQVSKVQELWGHIWVNDYFSQPKEKLA